MYFSYLKKSDTLFSSYLKDKKERTGTPLKG